MCCFVCGFGLEVLGFFKAEISFSRTEGKNCIYLATSNFQVRDTFFFQLLFYPRQSLGWNPFLWPHGGSTTGSFTWTFQEITTVRNRTEQFKRTSFKDKNLLFLVFYRQEPFVSFQVNCNIFKEHRTSYKKKKIVL